MPGKTPQESRDLKHDAQAEEAMASGIASAQPSQEAQAPAKEITSQPGTAVTAAAAPVTHVRRPFSGRCVPNGIQIWTEVADPRDSTGRSKTNTPVKKDVLESLLVDRVSGWGTVEKTQAPHLSLSGELGETRPQQITVFGDETRKLEAFLRGKCLGKPQDKVRMLKEPIEVYAVGKMMPNRNSPGTYGFNVDELYVQNADGTRTPIIDRPGQPQEASTTEDSNEKNPFEF